MNELDTPGQVRGMGEQEGLLGFLRLPWSLQVLSLCPLSLGVTTVSRTPDK